VRRTNRAVASRALVVIVGALSAGLLIGAPGIASAETGQRHKQLTHYTPTTKNLRAPQQLDNLTYGGAKVQVRNTNYVILWEPPKLQDGSNAFVSAQYNALMQRYFNDVGGNGLYNNNTQYYEVVRGTKRFIKNISTLGGLVVDTTAYPTGQCTNPQTGTNCVTDQNIVAEINKVRRPRAGRSRRRTCSMS
jgi:hypothetical protein